MFKRKLHALDFHDAETFNVEDERSYRNLMIWLEDQKIRHYQIKDRENLRDVDSQQWPNALHKYINDVGCPVPPSNKKGMVDWVLGYAVRLEYGDSAEKYRSATAENVKNNKVGIVDSSQTVVDPSSPLANLDVQSPEFKNGVDALAKLLNIPRHPDHLVTLQACSRFVRDRLATNVVENPEDHTPSGKAFQIDNVDMGFDTGDKVLNDACKILRLLYIRDLRKLQTKINECIVSVQNLTADPRIDTRIGKVGR